MFRESDFSPEKYQGPEKERKDAVSYLIITRHAQRYAGKNVVKDASGASVTIQDPETITPKGTADSVGIGVGLKVLKADWFKPTGSREERTLQTGEWAGVGLATGEKKGKRTKVLQTRPRSFYAYKDVLLELEKIDPQRLRASKVIQEKLPVEFLEVSPEERADIREAIQPEGLKTLLDDQEICRAMAESSAYRIVHDLEVLRRKVGSGETGIMLPVGHGAFFEALCKEALARQLPDGSQKTGFDNIEEIGGFLKPGEYFIVKMIRQGKVEKLLDETGEVVKKDPGGEKLEFAFSDSERLEGQRFWLDMAKIEALAKKMQEKIKRFYQEKERYAS